MTRALAAMVVGLAAGPAPGQVFFQGGFGYGYGPVFFPPPPLVVVVPPPVVVVQPSAATVVRAMFPPSDDSVELARRPARDVDPAAFRVVRPQKAVRVLPVRPVVPAPAADPPIPKDPKLAAVAHVAAAKAAFLVGQYGRAAERLNDATAAAPGDPLAYFLLAQVRTARGEYGEAVAAIRDGMTRAPDWPASGFRPREWYGPAAEAFDAHLGELRRASADRPADPALLFLLGYHLWFLGDKDDAAKLFREAAGRVRDGGVVERFLIEADGKNA